MVPETMDRGEAGGRGETTQASCGGEGDCPVDEVAESPGCVQTLCHRFCYDPAGWPRPYHSNTAIARLGTGLAVLCAACAPAWANPGHLRFCGTFNATAVASMDKSCDQPFPRVVQIAFLCTHCPQSILQMAIVPPTSASKEHDSRQSLLLLRVLRSISCLQESEGRLIYRKEYLLLLHQF